MEDGVALTDVDAVDEDVIKTVDDGTVVGLGLTIDVNTELELVCVFISRGNSGIERD